MENHQLFDEKASQGLDLLLHHFWILRAGQPEWYQLIREREKVLRRYINDKFGLRLIVHQNFIKLEKIPAEPEAWMGIQEFQKPMDYSIFCCALSYLEGKAVEEQFLLSELCQEIQAEYPGDSPLDWTLYIHRKSLIRALNVLMDLRLVRTVDGDTERFGHHIEQEVLYEATIYSRYFMRSFLNDVSSLEDWKELLEQDWKLNQEDMRRKRVYRRLFLSPGVYRKDTHDPDFLYIRNFRNRLTEDIEKHSEYTLHVYKNTAFLSVAEPKQYHQVFPNTKASTDLILQLSKQIHGQPGRFIANENGDIVLTEGELEQLIDEMRQEYGAGWSKHFRELGTTGIRHELLGEMEQWLMAEVDVNTSLIRIRSLAGVMTGQYPGDFKAGGTKDD